MSPGRETVSPEDQYQKAQKKSDQQAKKKTEKRMGFTSAHRGVSVETDEANEIEPILCA